MRIAIMIAALGIVTAAPMFAPTTLLPQAEAQATDAALPALTSELETLLNLALLGTPAQVRAKMAALIRANRGSAIALAAQAAARNQAMAADFAGFAAEVVTASELGNLYQAVAGAAPSAGNAGIATAIRDSSPPGTDTSNLEAAIVQGPNNPDTAQPVVTNPTGGGMPPKPPEDPVVPEVPEPNPSQAGSPV